MKICFGTQNPNKIREISQLLGKQFHIVSLESLGQVDELSETHDTFEGNALEKAMYVFNKYNIACFADDSGLEVESLQGAPGVYSARYAGLQKSDSNNIQLLLDNLQNCQNRSAQFRTVIAFVDETGKKFFEGKAKGRITTQPRGSNGFGYDSIFIPEGYTTTYAEMFLAEKNALSARAIAFRKFIEYLRTLEQSINS